MTPCSYLLKVRIASVEKLNEVAGLDIWQSKYAATLRIVPVPMATVWKDSAIAALGSDNIAITGEILPLWRGGSSLGMRSAGSPTQAGEVARGAKRGREVRLSHHRGGLYRSESRIGGWAGEGKAREAGLGLLGWPLAGLGLELWALGPWPGRVRLALSYAVERGEACGAWPGTLGSGALAGERASGEGRGIGAGAKQLGASGAWPVTLGSGASAGERP